jgi:hypothetical protein
VVAADGPVDGDVYDDGEAAPYEGRDAINGADAPGELLPYEPVCGATYGEPPTAPAAP